MPMLTLTDIRPWQAHGVRFLWPLLVEPLASATNSRAGGANSLTAQPSFNYHRYLASREWALLKRAVAERSEGLCERCHFRPAAEVHHLSYEHIGHEDLCELQHVCKPCHRFESGLTDWNPAICNCDPITVWEWAELMVDESPDVYGAALRHAWEVSDAYA